MKNKTNRTLRKILSIALCLALVMSYVPMVSITASAAATDITVTIDTGASVTLRDADGDDYYDIGTADELYAFAAAINSGKDGVNGELTANIVVNKNVLTANGDLNGNGSDFRVWTPIGYEVSSADREYFEGLFDGNNYTISGLYYNGSAMLVGLFGYGYGATIRNVGIIDSYMCSNYSDTSSRGYIGGVAATFNYDGVSMENCYNKGTIIATTDRVYAGGVVGKIDSIEKISNSYNTGKVVGKSYVGGVVGYFTYSSLIDCYNTGDISGDEFVGGIAGHASLSKNYVEKCYNTGNINCTGNYAGGIIAYLSGSYSTSYDRAITKCYNTGNINSSGNYVGGLAGRSDPYKSIIRNSYNVGDVSGIKYVGGIVGENAYFVQNCYNLGDVSGTSYVGGVSGGKVGNNSAIQNCYYLTDTATGGIGGLDAVGEAEVKTAEQFASGEIAYLLQGEQTEQVWGQSIGSDTLPVFATESNKVYSALNCHNDITYSNTQQEDGHHTGGTATCKELAKCEHCGVSYGELADHTGGTATCQTQAVCEVCKESYGELDPNNHEYEKNNGICCDTYQPAELNENGYYEIGNAGQLFWFANYINTVDRTANAVLTADIDLENRPWTPIGETNEAKNNFRGIFDGQNHTIKGLYVEGGRAGLGFFGEVRTGTVKNFTIYGEVVANTDVNYVGGVIGSICGLNGDNDLERNGAIIQNITSYVNLTAKTHGIGMIGGFVGYANHESLIENCSWYGTFDAGEYRVDSGAGGFIGKIQENTSEVTIRNCGAYGTIKTNYAKNSYNNTPTIYMGGFLSFSNTNAQTTIENCLFAGKFECGENLTDEARLGAFGTLRSVNAIKNCYYLGDDGLEAVHSDSNLKPGSDNVEITSVTGEQLKSGEVAYLLGEAWGQMSNTEGSLPIITDNELYKVVTVGETGNYSVANVGDANGDGTVDVTDYQALVNTILADDHEQIETASYDDIVKYDLDGDGYLDVIDASLMHLFINGLTTVDVYAVGDYDLNGKAFEEADIKAIKHAIENPEKLATYKKYASDINGDGKLDENDLTALTAKYGEVTGTECADNVEVYYRWDNNYSTCTATAMCTLCGKKVATETVNTTSETLAELTCTQDGKVKYTATFQNELLGTKTIEIVLKTEGHKFDDNGFCLTCDVYQPAELNESGYYEIGNAGQLFWFAQQVNVKGNKEIKGALTADIDLENKPWTPIGAMGEENSFRGVFDGQNYTIRGLNVEGSENGVGFFGEVRTGTVKNFTIYGEVVMNAEVDYVGGVIGAICGLDSENDLERNGAVIQNITSYVNVTANAHGIGMIGGFVGYADHQSLIEKCSWYGTFDAGEYRVDSGAGGFIGKIQENTSEVTIRNCGAYGTIKTNYAKNSYNNNATIYMGGFLSFSNTGAKTTLENCLFAGKFERGENLTDEARLGAFGTLRSVNSIKNCYYLGDDGLAAVHSDSPLKPGSDNVEIISVTEDDLRNNTIATQLGNYWEQGEDYPVIKR